MNEATQCWSDCLIIYKMGIICSFYCRLVGARNYWNYDVEYGIFGEKSNAFE